MVTNAYQFDVSVRPYTLRKGDTLKSIAQKRGEQRCCFYAMVQAYAQHGWITCTFSAAYALSQQRCTSTDIAAQTGPWENMSNSNTPNPPVDLSA